MEVFITGFFFTFCLPGLTSSVAPCESSPKVSFAHFLNFELPCRPKLECGPNSEGLLSDLTMPSSPLMVMKRRYAGLTLMLLAGLFLCGDFPLCLCGLNGASQTWGLKRLNASGLTKSKHLKLALCAMSSEDSNLLKKMDIFCHKQNICTTGVLAITIQKNRSARCASLIIDMDKKMILPNYPAEFPSKYKELWMSKDKWIVVYHERLQLPSSPQMPPAGQERVSQDAFCCKCLDPYKPIRLDGLHEEIFKDFLNAKGTRGDLVYEVREQVNNGPNLALRYFVLKGNCRRIVEKPFAKKKLSAYKNYICPKHNRFFSVNLYRSTGTQAADNFHHMRCILYTQKDLSVLSEFFEDVGCGM